MAAVRRLQRRRRGDQLLLAAAGLCLPYAALRSGRILGSIPARRRAEAEVFVFAEAIGSEGSLSIGRGAVSRDSGDSIGITDEVAKVDSKHTLDVCSMCVAVAVVASCSTLLYTKKLPTPWPIPQLRNRSIDYLKVLFFHLLLSLIMGLLLVLALVEFSAVLARESGGSISSCGLSAADMRLIAYSLAAFLCGGGVMGYARSNCWVRSMMFDGDNLKTALLLAVIVVSASFWLAASGCKEVYGMLVVVMPASLMGCVSVGASPIPVLATDLST